MVANQDQTRPVSTLYVRQATGLIREIGFGTNVAIALSFMSIPYAALIATTGAMAFPGANLVLAVVLAGILCVPMVYLFGWLGTVMPRSGGDYVFVSRIISPLVGFAASFNLTVWFLLVLALFGAILASFGLSAALAAMGVALHNAGLVDWSARVASKGWQFGVGTAALALTAVLMSLRGTTWQRVFRVVFYASLAGVVVAIVVMLLRSRAVFSAALPAFGTSYDAVLQAGSKAGYRLNAPFSLWATLAATPLAFNFFGFGIVPVYSGGEIRSPRQTLIRALLTAVVLGGLVVLLMVGVAVATFGHDFLGAATYLSTFEPKQYPFSAPSFLFLFVAMLTHNSVLIAVIGISFALAFLAAFPPTFLIVSRNLFAWSFDRVIPSRVAAVNDRTHSPVFANLVVTVACIAFLALIVYGPATILTFVYAEVAGVALTWMVTAIAGATFPFRRAELYQRSPISRHRLLGLPAITVVGALAFAAYLVFLVPLLTNTALGVRSTPGITALVVIAVTPFLLYAVSYAVQRRRGVDLSVAFRELPPE